MEDEKRFSIKEKVFGKKFREASLSRVYSTPGADEVAKFLKKPQRFLVHLGGVGIGKTYLMASIYDYFLDKLQGRLEMKYFNDAALFGFLRSCHGDYYQNLKSIADTEMLFLDDIGFCGVTDWRVETLSTLINLRHTSERPTIISSNFKREKIFTYYGERFFSRVFDAENIIIENHDLPDQRTLKNREK